MACEQVKRAQAHLLEHLYSAVTTLGGAEAEFLLEEESESVVKREKLKKVPALRGPAMHWDIICKICDGGHHAGSSSAHHVCGLSMLTQHCLGLRRHVAILPSRF